MKNTKKKLFHIPYPSNRQAYSLSVKQTGIFHEYAFTLIEIIFTLTVISILSLISLSAYKQLSPALTLKSETRIIASDLRYAQQLAVSTQDTCRVNFDINQNKYSIINSSTDQIIKNRTIDSQISIDLISGLTNNQVSFNPAGAATESGSLIIINSQNNTSTIEIKPSGYVKIKN